ncbi:sugar phosphate isomerase/epimerase family protein [Lacticaseibacillus suihuaensis]
MKIALQLWSVRDACDEDFIGTLRRLKDMGYDGVEFAGYRGVEAPVLKAAMDEIGLVSAGSHIGFDRLAPDQLAATLDYEAVLGNKRIIIPYMNFEDVAGWRHFFTQLNALAPQIRQRGMQLMYHNHANEVCFHGDTDILAEMLAAVPDVSLEVDVGLLTSGGGDLKAWLTAHAARISQFHIKDMKPDLSVSTNLGTGVIPLADCVAFASQHEIEWLVIEHDVAEPTQMADAAANQRYLATLVDKL